MVCNLHLEIHPHSLPCGVSPKSIQTSSRRYITIRNIAMTKAERRKTRRKIIDKLAYVNLEPNNGGIVLNISEGGLCFQTLGPVRQGKVVDFWLSLPDKDRIEGVGELAWTDARRKTGGLRFTFLPEGVLEQVCDTAIVTAEPLIARVTSTGIETAPAAKAVTATLSEQVVSHLPESTSLQKATFPQIKAVSEASSRSPSTLPAAASRPIAKPTPTPFAPRVISMALAAARHVDKSISTALAVSMRHLENAIPKASTGTQFAMKKVSTASRSNPWASLFRGAVPGLIVLIIAGALVELGGLPEGRVLPQVVSSAAVPSPPLDSPKIAAHNASSVESENNIREGVDALDSESGNAIEAPPIPTRRPPRTSTTHDLPAGKIPDAAIQRTSPTHAFSPKSAAPTSSISIGTTSEPLTASVKPTASSPVESTHPPTVSNAEITAAVRATSTLPNIGSASLVYFRVGTFKDARQADAAAEALGHLGFHAIVIHKTLLWLNSYYILAGPFADDGVAETARRDLESQGFKPRVSRMSPSQ